MQNKTQENLSKLVIKVGNTMVLQNLRIFWNTDSVGVKSNKHLQNNNKLISFF